MTESDSRSLAQRFTRGELPIILVAAVVQGWTLYALHYSIDHSVWPATKPGTLAALYATAAFVPLTVQMLAAFIRRPLTWAIAAVFVAFYVLIGWHYGKWIFDGPIGSFPDPWFELALVVGILWLLVMPFLQARLMEGRWRSRYELLFSVAWNNKLVLAEAAAFTGIFWLMLELWALLFQMLEIRFFTELFQKPIFIYPVTSIVFGVALNLIGSLERLTRVLLEQMLSVLKWLALLAGVILALFTAALVVKLPGMISSGDRAIAALWLLWLVAVVVLLVNAAYRDGSTGKPYPPAIGLALRCVIPLTVVVALVAVYALWLRIDQYGLSVSRFWACVVAGAAALYSVGYALAARHRAHWMRTVAGVNVLTALYLIAALGLALTPLLSPYRLSARSQFAMALEESSGPTVGRAYNGSSSMDYLRFSAGKYGRDRLEELSRLEGHPRAEEIRREAKAELERQHQYEPVRYDSATFLAKIVIYPAGRTLDPQLAELAGNEQRLYGPIGSGPDIAGVFVDLDRDQTEEFVLLRTGMAVLFRNEGGSWRRVEAMLFDEYQDPQTVVEAVRAGDVASEPPRWDDLVIGKRRYRLPPAVR